MFSKISIGLWSLDSTHYWGGADAIEKIRMATRIEGLGGVELIYPTQVNEKNCTEIKRICGDAGIAVASVNPNIWSDPLFAKGAFTSHDPAARSLAVRYGKGAYDLARELGATYMCLWPGQDGFDYPFQSDYRDLWARELDGIGEVAAYAAGHLIGIEYKAREPRSHILLDSASSVLHFAAKLGADNVGIHLDFGHALLARENPGEAAARAMGEGKLYGVHLNDNYGSTDEDMLAMSVHHLETLEFLHWLRETGYSGWMSFEFNARSEDPVEACSLSIRNLRRMEAALDRLDLDALSAARSNQDVRRTLELANAALLGRA